MRSIAWAAPYFTQPVFQLNSDFTQTYLQFYSARITSHCARGRGWSHHFYAAGNQADNNSNNTGDQIYTTQVSIPPAPPATGLPLASSLLLFNLYTSSAANPRSQNTRVNITNTSQDRSVAVRFFMVDGSDGSAATESLCLAPNQTFTFQASDLDPGVTGYLIAVAVDAAGCPINFNSLSRWARSPARSTTTWDKHSGFRRRPADARSSLDCRTIFRSRRRGSKT